MELSLVLVALVVGLLTFWAVRSFVADAMLRAEVSEELVRIVGSEPAAIDVLGQPVRRAGSATGGVYRMRDGIRTTVAIPVAGPHAHGIVYVNALRQAARWLFASMTLHVERRAVRIAPKERL